jgi:hypothetical protein
MPRIDSLTTQFLASLLVGACVNYDEDDGGLLYKKYGETIREMNLKISIYTR